MRRLLPILFLVGCSYYTDLDQPLIAPGDAIARGDALYIPMPHVGDVVRVSEAGAERIDLDPGHLQQLLGSADGEVLLAREIVSLCDEEADGPDLDDCPYGELREVGLVERIGDDGVEGSFDVGAWFGDFVFSDDGRYAVAAVDPNADVSSAGIVNLTSVMVLDLAMDAQWEVSVGFEADTILFGYEDGVARRMVVLSRSEVAVVDLTAAVPVPEATFPLTLDPDDVVRPVAVQLTGDGRYALITVQDSPDLYALDLVDPSINIVSLAGRPAAMAVDDVHDQTVIAYADTSVIEVLDHDLFDLTTLDVDEAVTRIEMGPDVALLWSDRGVLDAYRLDLEALRVDEYRLNFAPQRVLVSPDFEFAASLAPLGDQGRLEVLDLTEVDGRVDDDPKPFGLAGAAVDAAFSVSEGATNLLLLQSGVDELFELSWPALQVGSLALEAPPSALGELPAGGFWITHPDPLGLVSFYTPGSDPVAVGGFGVLGIHDDRELMLEEEE